MNTPRTSSAGTVRRAGRRYAPLRLMAGLLYCVALAPACVSQAPTAAPPRAVLLIVIDTLREDRLGFAHHPGAVTPTLDSLAASGVYFSDAMTPVPVTLPAVSSLLTGRIPPHHGVRDNDRFVLPETEETLADQFRSAGWRTGAVLGSAVLSRDRGLARGFDTWDDAFTGPFPVYDRTIEPLAESLAHSQRRADVVTDRAIDLVKSYGQEPWFLLVHYFDVHMFYDPPPRYAALHPGDAYDGEVSFVDAEIGRLLRQVRQRNDVLVVVVSDHGESNGEHGEPQHGFLLYQSTLHVVAMASGAGVPAGVVRPDLVSLIDVAPTLTRVCQLPRNKTPRDGRALTWGRPETGEVTQYAESFRPLISYNWSELRALRRGRWKLVEGAGRSELYDLEADSREQTDRGAAEPAARLQRELRKLTAGDDAEAVYRTATGRGSPGRTEMLEGLGYIGRGVETAQDAPRRPHPLEALPHWLDTQNAKTLFKRAYVRLMAGAAGEACDELDQCLALDPRIPEAHYLRGYARKLLGRPAEALEDFEACLRLKPDYEAARTQKELVEEALSTAEAP